MRVMVREEAAKFDVSRVLTCNDRIGYVECCVYADLKIRAPHALLSKHEYSLTYEEVAVNTLLNSNSFFMLGWMNKMNYNEAVRQRQDYTNENCREVSLSVPVAGSGWLEPKCNINHQKKEFLKKKGTGTR